MAQAIIMAGGQGERFWPMTHGKFPKYRIRFNGKESLLQKTYKRLLCVYSANSIYVVTTQPHFKLIREELPKLPIRNILIEPFRNNTAAAIFLSCELMRKKFGDNEILSFFPADQLIQNENEFKKTMTSVMRLADKKESLVTVGIRPGFASTGYGYIEKGKAVSGYSGAYLVKRFVEKPNVKKALNYIKSRNFLWNAGIFTWKTNVFLKTMRRFSPDFSKNFNLKDLSKSYKKLPNRSIDYALMEKADNVTIFETRMDWCDMGNWDMYHEKSPASNDGIISSGKVYRAEAVNSLLLNYTEQPLVALGVRDLIVVNTPLGTLVCKKGMAEAASLFFKKMNS